MKRALAATTVLLALLGIGLSIEHLLDADHYNPGFVEHPGIIGSHVVLGALYLALALLQFSASLRERRPRLHRALGRVAVAAGLVAGSTALLATLLFPYSGPLAIAVVGPFACLFVGSLAHGLWSARRRRYREHREWMIRALAIGTSIATMRLIFVPAMLLLGEYSDEERARWLSLASFGAAFVLHSASAEAWIRATRSREAPLPAAAHARSELRRPLRQRRYGRRVTSRLSSGLVRGDDGVVRCFWCVGDADYRLYHDREWGFPVADDVRLFEKLCLEGFQAGLSWLTILRKRENFRRAFRGFEIEAVARMGARDVARLLRDAGIVRHRGKIEAALANARSAAKVKGEFGSLARYVWRFEPTANSPSRPRRVTRAALRRLTESAESRALSKDLRARGFRFVGPTTMYAFMQAMGLVNDHLEGCAAREHSLTGRARFQRP